MPGQPANLRDQLLGFAIGYPGISPAFYRAQKRLYLNEFPMIQRRIKRHFQALLIEPVLKLLDRKQVRPKLSPK